MEIISITLGFVQFSIIGYLLCKEVMRNSPVAFLWATLFVMFGFPHLITTIIHDFSYSDTVISKASIFVISFCAVYILFRNKKKCKFVELRGSKFEIENDIVTTSVLEQVVFVILSFSVLSIVFNIVRSSGGLLNTSWASVREIESGYLVFQALANRLIFTFSGLSLYYFLTGRRKKAILVLSLFTGLTLVTRNRVQIIPVLAFFVSLYIIKISKIRIKHILIGVIVAVCAIYLIYAIRAFRWLGSLSDAINNFSWRKINSTVIKFLSERDGELGLRQHFYYFIQNDNNFEGFNRGYTLIRMLLVYIPSRVSLGLKPQGFDLYMGQAIGMVEGGSMHPTLFGDCFGNFYWFGIIIGGLWAGFANVIDGMISKQKYPFFKIMIFFLSAYSYVVMGRGSVYNGFEVLAWGILILSILKPFSSKLANVHFVWRLTSSQTRKR